MPEIRFYHLTKSSPKQALPQLLEKTRERGKRALVKLPDEEAVRSWNEHLWSYKAGSFLPHGTHSDSDPQSQPIFLTQGEENPGQGEYLFLIDGALSNNLQAFELVALVFDAKVEAAVLQARQQWKELRETGLTLTYWQQDEAGGWHKKA